MRELCRIVRHLGSGIQRGRIICHPAIKNDSQSAFRKRRRVFVVRSIRYSPSSGTSSGYWRASPLMRSSIRFTRASASPRICEIAVGLNLTSLTPSATWPLWKSVAHYLRGVLCRKRREHQRVQPFGREPKLIGDVDSEISSARIERSGFRFLYCV